MKICGEILTRRQTKRGSQVARGTGSAGPMKRAVNGAGLLANVFHDVDFTAGGPTHRGDVVAKHPESGPHPLPYRNLDARFKAAVGLAEEPLCLDASRSVTARDAIRAGKAFLLRSNDQISTFDLRILKAIGVALEFLVAPT